MLQIQAPVQGPLVLVLPAVFEAFAQGNRGDHECISNRQALLFCLDLLWPGSQAEKTAWMR